MSYVVLVIKRLSFPQEGDHCAFSYFIPVHVKTLRLQIPNAVDRMLHFFILPKPSTQKSVCYSQFLSQQYCRVKADTSAHAGHNSPHS